MGITIGRSFEEGNLSTTGIDPIHIGYEWVMSQLLGSIIGTVATHYLLCRDFLLRNLPIIGSAWPISPCWPLCLSWGLSMPTGLSKFPLANSCGNDTFVFKISWMCVSCLENCNNHRMWKNVFVEAESYFYSILRLFLVNLKNVFNVKICCPPDQNPSNK
jgi:hypothetical protein